MFTTETETLITIISAMIPILFLMLIVRMFTDTTGDDDDDDNNGGRKPIYPDSKDFSEEILVKYK